MFARFFLLISIAIFASGQKCTKGRLTQYPIYMKNGIPQGTCNFGPVYDKMPIEFKQGRIIAANQDYYNGFVTKPNFKETCISKNGVSCGFNCGQCVMVTGAKGTETFIIADIGDVPTVGIEDAGDMVQFAINNNPKNGLLSVADNPGYEYMSFIPVPCSSNGNIGFFFPESGSNKWSVALTLYNYKFPLKKVEVKGAGPNVRTPNEFIELPREWTNKFVWRGVEGYPGQKGDIYNGGNAFQLRITSIFDEVFAPSTLYSIPSTNITTSLFDLGFQFQKNSYSQSDFCKWTGPYSKIYDDKVISRKKNWSTKNYDSCLVGSSGCRTYFEGDFLVEWWLVYQVNLGKLNLEYSGEECRSKSCIEVTYVAKWGIIILGHSSNFRRDSYKNVSFAGKLSSKSGIAQHSLSVTFDGCSQSVDFSLNKNWQNFSFEISRLSCPEYIKNLKFVFGAGDIIYLDDIKLLEENSNLIDPYMSSIA